MFTRLQILLGFLFLIVPVSWSSETASQVVEELMQASWQKQSRWPSNCYYFFRKRYLLSEEEIDSQIKKTFQETDSGRVLYRCLLAFLILDIDLEKVPAPRKEALREYFGEFLFYDFEPSLFWPCYETHWQEGMRNVHRHALMTGYRFHNLNHAVSLMPLLFDAKTAGDIYHLPSLITAANYSYFPLMSWYCLGDQELHRDGLIYWIYSIWDKADTQRKRELVDTLYLKPLNRTGYIPENRLCFQDFVVYSEEELLPLHDWFSKNPEILSDLLKSGNVRSRSRVLAVATEKKPYLVDVSSPEIIQLLIEGLKTQWAYYYNGYQSNPCVDGVRLLLENSSSALLLIRQTLIESSDPRQKEKLCSILIYLKDDESREQVLDYLCSLLVAEETAASRKPLWWWGMHRFLRVPDMIVTIGEPAVESLLKRIQSMEDPQQLALSLLIIDQLGRFESVNWNEERLNTLLLGLHSNRVGMDQGFCAAVLKKRSKPIQDFILNLPIESPDEQQRLSVQILRYYHQGDRASYYALKGEHSSFNPSRPKVTYWEFTERPGSDYLFGRRRMESWIKEMDSKLTP